MPDTDPVIQSPAAGIKKDTKAQVVAAPTPVLTPDARGIEQMQFARILARDDAARAEAGSITLVAISAFTIVEDDNVGLPIERVVKAGEEFEISAHDLPRYSGRGRPKVLDAPNKAGVTISRE